MKNKRKPSVKVKFNHKRTILATHGSMTMNFLTALVKIVAGVVGMSVFTVISGFYSIGIGFAKLIYAKGTKISEASTKLNCYAAMAFILIAAAVLYIVYSVRLLFFPPSFGFGLKVAIAVAATAFYDLGSSINGLIKARKHGDFLLSGLKKINFSSALAAIALTQVALLSVMGENAKTAALSTAAMGFAVGAVSVVLGGIMLYDCNKRKRQTLDN